MTKASATFRQRGFSAYGTYVAKLRDLARESQQAADWNERAVAALNGQATLELRRVISLKTRRRFGAFFTGSELATRLISRCSKFDNRSVIYDPTLGMGDLLIATARQLPLGRTLNETLKRWGQQLSGTDIHANFIEGAKTRLVILAQQRHGLKASGVTSLTGLFPSIRVADGLAQHRAFARATHLVLNPPFGLTAAPDGCTWAGGRITGAANFVITALERAKPGAELVAILPDVLRSGSFTNQWRNRIEELFILRVKRRAKNSVAKSVPWIKVPVQPSMTIGDYFNVQVGRVVPHRDLVKGKKHPYIHARCILTWKVMREFTEFLRFDGKVFKPPFVVKVSRRLEKSALIT